MAWFEESERQKEQGWQTKIAQRRLDLSASVEETLGDSSSMAEEWEEEDENPKQVSQSTALIPPRLSLQSKQLPAVKSQAAAEPKFPSLRTNEWREGRIVESDNMIARVAHRISASLSTFERRPHNDVANSALQSEQGDYLERKERPPMKTGTIPAARPVNSTSQTGSKYGTAKRTTKVRLQVVPKTDPAPNIGERVSTICDAATNPSLPTIRQTEGHIALSHLAYDRRESMSGLHIFEAGQSDVEVTNTNITASSVVVVMLTADPGPVVVQYVSLRPALGFTIHLSAPAKNKTPFNYAILAG